MGRVLGSIHYQVCCGHKERPSVQLSIRISDIFGWAVQNIQIDQLCDKDAILQQPQNQLFLNYSWPGMLCGQHAENVAAARDRPVWWNG